MTGLAALAHSAPSAQPFDATYYATIPTVIPVLYLAYALQGPAFETLLRSALSAGRDQIAGQSLWQPRGRAATWVAARLPPALLPRALLTAAFLILTAGATGEASALWVLYKGHDDPSTRLFVFIATMILLLAVITPPLLSYFRVTLLLQDYRAKVRPKGAAEQHRAPQSAGPAHPGPPETGKTDPA